MATRKTNAGQGSAGPRSSETKSGTRKSATKAGAAKPRATAAKSGAKAAAGKSAATKSATTKSAANQKTARPVDIIDATAIDVTPADTGKPAKPEPSASSNSEKPEPVVEMPEPGAKDRQTGTGDAGATEQEPKKDQSQKPLAEPGQTERRRGKGFGLDALAVTALLGGVLGWGAVTYLPGTDTASQTSAPGPALAELDARVGDLATKVEQLSDADLAPAPVDLGPLQARLDDLATKMDSAQQEAQTAITDLTARVAALEAQRADQTTQTGPSAQTLAALDDLRAQIEAQMARNTELGDQLSAALAEAQAKADEAAKKNARLARLANGQVALTHITAALASGQPFDGDIPALRRAVGPIPEALSDAAATGVTPLTDLQAGFDDLSRKALLAARAETEGDGGGFWSFLRSQVSTRSTKPVEGDSPDAILSRASAAVEDGDLTKALDLIGTLPAVSRDVLADWTAQATRRQAVVDALVKIEATLNP